VGVWPQPGSANYGVSNIKDIDGQKDESDIDHIYLPGVYSLLMELRYLNR
jgi:hypothetical protein